MRTFLIGTRGSALARAQAEMVKSALQKAAPGVKTEILPIKTTGDILSDAPLDVIGGKGVFVKDIEHQLLEGKIDIAVHSLKDMQATLPEGLTINGYLKREDPRDMLFSNQGHTLKSLPIGSRVGTSSMRRRCQLKHLRPDLAIIDLRGNVPTRLGKVGKAVDAVILAAAGIIRLDLPLGVAIDPEMMVPSPGQGIIAVESRCEDNETGEMLKMLDHAETRLCAETERAFLRTLGQDCNLPAGALAVSCEGGACISGMLGSSDETLIERMSLTGDSPEVGGLLASCLMEKIHRGGVS
jgi:hydroxymethylbilane synthase